MAKKGGSDSGSPRKSGKGGGGMLWKMILFVLFVVLIANFCWGGKPLYKVVFPRLDHSVEQTVDKVGDVTKNGLEKAKDTVVDTAQEVKDKVTGETKKSEFSKKDREELDQVIKDNVEKKK